MQRQQREQEHSGQREEAAKFGVEKNERRVEREGGSGDLVVVVVDVCVVGLCSALLCSYGYYEMNASYFFCHTAEGFEKVFGESCRVVT